MRKLLIPVIFIMLCICMAGNAKAIVLDFDTIISEGRTAVPEGYGGLNWDSFVVFTGGILPYHYDAGIVSGNYAVFNASSNTAFISDGRFSFTGANLSSAEVMGEGPLPVTVRGYRGDENIFSETIYAGVGAAWYDFCFTNIDSLTFGSASQFVMDDFTYTPSPAPVPEPATALLLAAGFGLFSFKRWKR